MRDNCRTGDMNLYEIDENGDWQLMDMDDVPTQNIGGIEYFALPVSGSGSRNLDKRAARRRRTRYKRRR